mgnify:CR=1 FL=1
MKKNVKKVISFILSMLVIISTAVTPAMAAGTKEAPTEVKSVTASGLWTTVLNLEFEDTTWMDNINKVIVNDKECKKSTINSFSSDTNIWEVGSATGAYGSYKALKLAVPDGKLWTVKVSADGYKDLTVKITKETVNYTDTYKAEVVSNSGETTNKTYTADVTPAVNGKITLSAAKDIKEGDTVTVTATPDENYEVVAVTVKGVSGKSVDVQNAEGIYTFKMPAENVTVSATFKEKAIAGNKKIEVSQVSINKDLWGSDWEFTFKNAEDYVSAIKDVKVNGTSWEEKSYSVSSGGQYYKNTSSNKLVCAAREYSANPTIPVLKTGSSICGQLRLADGAILENAAIYSHANYLANGDLTDRNTSEPVVTATGNVTIKGQVFIKGAEDGDGIGQTALRVDGTLRLADGAILVTTGGEGMINENDGGTAIDIKSGKITGNGKLVAIGGKTFWGNGGNAVTGNGTIETASVFLQGATASKAKNKEAGKAIGDNIRVITSDRYIKDGEVSDNYGTDDALSGLYWKEGIDATPPLDKYVTSEVENILSLEGTLDKTYDGKAVNGPVVKAGDKVLAEGTDYTLTYKDSEGNELSETPVNAGTYTVTVNGLGTYAGMNLNVTFTISPKAAELTVVADPSSAKYDGKSKTPEVTVKDGDKVLKEGTDYTLSYVYGEDAETKDFAGAEFVKEGNYTITVTGIGNYEGSTGKAVFTISKNNSASTDPTNPSNPNGDKNVTDKKVSNNTNNVKPVVKNVAAKNNKNVPKTGDNANVLLWIALAVISCGVLAGAGVAVRKRK